MNIINETQFALKYEKEWFDVGRFWDAPSNIHSVTPFSQDVIHFGVPLDIMVSLVLSSSTYKFLVN